MKIRQKLWIGVWTGLVMGVALFIVGAIASLIVYGPQMAPEGKFDPEQLNVWYFIWTKLLIGIFFGLLFIVIYEGMPIKRRIAGIRDGLKYAAVLWLVITLWDLSHPLLYDSDAVNWQNQIFWLLYTLGGFLIYGISVGYAYKRLERPQLNQQ